MKPLTQLDKRMAIVAEMGKYLDQSFNMFLNSDLLWDQRRAVQDLRNAVESFNLICDAAERSLSDHSLFQHREPVEVLVNGAD
jgi:hypothetical protein